MNNNVINNTIFQKKVNKRENDDDENGSKKTEGNLNYQELNKKIKNLELENNRLKVEKKKIEESTQNQLKEKDELIKKQENELNSLKSKKKELENKIEEYEKKIITQLNQELAEKKKELVDTHSKFDGAINEFDGMRSKIEKQEQKIAELSKVEEENNKLKKENNEVHESIRIGKTREDFLVKSPEEYYDVIVDISSINSLKNEGWQIKYNKERIETYQKIISEETLKIGVLGLNNVGKSFLLSKIVKMDIPTGYSIETKGISIKYSKEEGEEKGICILDSAGFETPLLNEDHSKEEKNNEEKKNKEEDHINDINNNKGNENKEGEDRKDKKDIEENKNNEEDHIKDINNNKGNENKKGEDIKDRKGIEENRIKESSKNFELENALKYNEIEDIIAKDKAQTERFIEQLIIRLSDMIILVVGKLTRTEQRLITRIKNLVKKGEDNKVRSIIIIHNLAQYHTIKEVENHISHYLIRSATFKLLERKVIGIEKYLDRTYYVEKIKEDEKNLEIFHYVMAREGTEAGKYYNELTYELIKSQYNNFNQRKKIDIPKQIINLFSELSTDIFGEKMNCQKSESNENIIKLSNSDQENGEKKFNFNLQNTYTDQDGNYLLEKNKFEPKYSLYFYKEKKTKNEDDDDEDEEDEDNYKNYLLLRLEIPGNVIRLTARTTDPKKEKYKGIIIKGLKERDKFEEQAKKDFTIISDNRIYDEFSYFIELKRNLELSGTGAEGNTDIYKIIFDKRNKEKFFLKESKKEEKKEDNKKNKKEEVASGVYILKFNLTDRSFVQNK